MTCGWKQHPSAGYACVRRCGTRSGQPCDGRMGPLPIALAPRPGGRDRGQHHPSARLPPSRPSPQPPKARVRARGGASFQSNAPQGDCLRRHPPGAPPRQSQTWEIGPGQPPRGPRPIPTRTGEPPRDGTPTPGPRRHAGPRDAPPHGSQPCHVRARRSRDLAPAAHESDAHPKSAKRAHPPSPAQAQRPIGACPYPGGPHGCAALPAPPCRVPVAAPHPLDGAADAVAALRPLDGAADAPDLQLEPSTLGVPAAQGAKPWGCNPR